MRKKNNQKARKYPDKWYEEISTHKTGAMKFPDRSRWELNFVSEFNVNFNSHLDLPRNFFMRQHLMMCTKTKQCKLKSVKK